MHAQSRPQGELPQLPRPVGNEVVIVPPGTYRAPAGFQPAGSAPEQSVAALTHQDIADRLDKMAIERGHAWREINDRFAKQKAEIQALCGGIGHIAGRGREVGQGRVCLVCMATLKEKD